MEPWTKLKFENESLHLQQDQLERYIPKALVYSLLWALSGDGKLKSRQELGDFIRGVTTVPLPSQTNVPIIDFEVMIFHLIEIDRIKYEIWKKTGK